ncbi:MAG TPA: tRNA (guanosine(37)-N1)-methyltransferase TrmD [Candidatus Binatia bacterium]|nr:tRNA (guanosine(37)-N1)-methyltransferase TrmD [Candidatus Binatia bacterium]
MVRFTVITLFPGMFDSPLAHSILKRAREKKLIDIGFVDPRDFTSDKHRTVDDTPYGGGQGMVMKPEPLVAAIEAAKNDLKRPRVILLSPQGKLFDQAEAARLSREEEIVLVCGRYEGIDERVKAFVDEEISVGDYTLSGGELPALVVIDAVTRLIPGVLGNAQSSEDDSFSNGLLEYPQYTRPEEFRGLKVPEVLVSGDHEKIRRWRNEASVALTRERRPDMLAKQPSTAERVRHAKLYIALLHHPVYDKNHEIVTTAVTNMDVHDIARAARTYGLKGFYVVTPVKALQKLSLKIIAHWETGYGAEYNETRKEALALARVTDTLDDTIIDIERECGEKPRLIVTSARKGDRRSPFTRMRNMLSRETAPFLILLGTGWGLTDEVLARSDYIVEPIEGDSDYNHLSVRSAAAIILDRLLGTN